MDNERFSMKEYRPLTLMEKKLIVESEINEIENKRSPLGERVSNICAELSVLNSEIRGKRLPQEDFNMKQNQQNALLTEKIFIEKSIVSYKKQLRELNLKKDSLSNSMKVIPEGELKKTISSLRDKYMDFSSDTTRVSSTRIMASRFVEELQTILSKMDK